MRPGSRLEPGPTLAVFDQPLWIWTVRTMTEPDAPTSRTERSQFGLLATRRFGPFFVTQLLGAFNDNVFKNALVLLITYQAASLTSVSPDILVNLCGGIFILPFFLFSATAGQLADKFERSSIIRLIKVLEICIMGVGAAGFALQHLICCSVRCSCSVCIPPSSDR